MHVAMVPENRTRAASETWVLTRQTSAGHENVGGSPGLWHLNVYMYKSFACVYGYMVTWFCVYIFVCLYVYTFICLSGYMLFCSCGYVFICLEVHMFICLDVCMFICVCVHLDGCIYVHMYT